MSCNVIETMLYCIQTICCKDSGETAHMCRTEFYSNSGRLYSSQGIQSTSFGEGVLNFLTYISTTFSKQAVKADPEGGQGVQTPPEKSQN